MTDNTLHRLRRLIGIELEKLRSRRMTWTLLLIYAVLTAAIPWMFYVAGRYGEADDGASRQSSSAYLERVSFPGAFEGSLGSVLSFGLPLIMILSAAAFGGEFAWGTLRLLLIRGEARREYVITKLAAIYLVWLLAAAIGIAIGLVSATIVAMVGDLPGPAHAGDVDLPVFLGHVAASVVGGWVYIGMTSLATLRHRSTAFGIAFGLIIFFFDRIATEAAFATSLRPLEIVGKAGLNYNLRSLTGGAGDSANPLPIAIFALLAFLAGSIAASLRQLDKQDVTISGVG